MKIVYAFQQNVHEEEKEEFRFKIDEVYLKYPEVLLHVLREQFEKNIYGFDNQSLTLHSDDTLKRFNEKSLFEGSFIASFEDYDSTIDIEQWAFMVIDDEYVPVDVDKMKKFIESSIALYYLKDDIYKKMIRHCGMLTNNEYMAFHNLMGNAKITIDWSED